MQEQTSPSRDAGSSEAAFSCPRAHRHLSRGECRFTPGTLKEYKDRGVGRYTQLGTLGADLDDPELVKKREKAAATKQYARSVAQANQARPAPNPSLSAPRSVLAPALNAAGESRVTLSPRRARLSAAV